MNLSFRLAGYYGVAKKLGILSKEDLYAELVASANRMNKRANVLTPIDTGNLLESKATKMNAKSCVFGYNANYATWVEQGHYSVAGNWVNGRWYLKKNAIAEAPLFKRGCEKRLERLL